MCKMKYVVVASVVIGLVGFGVWYLQRNRTTSDDFSYASLEVHPSQTETRPKPTFSELSDNDEARLNYQREIVLSALKQEYGVSGLSKDEADLALLQRLLDDEVFSPDQTIELQSMGVVFGDVLANEFGMQWIMITDEYGTDPTLKIPETHHNFNALTMISKRIERGETVNLKQLFRIVELETKRIREQDGS